MRAVYKVLLFISHIRHTICKCEHYQAILHWCSLSVSPTYGPKLLLLAAISLSLSVCLCSDFSHFLKMIANFLLSVIKNFMVKEQLHGPKQQQHRGYTRKKRVSESLLLIFFSLHCCYFYPEQTFDRSFSYCIPFESVKVSFFSSTFFLLLTPGYFFSFVTPIILMWKCLPVKNERNANSSSFLVKENEMEKADKQTIYGTTMGKIEK